MIDHADDLDLLIEDVDHLTKMRRKTIYLRVVPHLHGSDLTEYSLAVLADQLLQLTSSALQYLRQAAARWKVLKMYKNRWLIGPIPAIGLILRGKCLPKCNILRVLIDDIVIIDLHKRHVIITLPRELHPLAQRIDYGLVRTWHLLDRLLYLGSIAAEVEDIPEGGMRLRLDEGVLLG